MKLPSLEGGVIIIKSDQKATRKCYENSLKNKRGMLNQVCSSFEESKSFMFDGRLDVLVRMDGFKLDGGGGGICLKGVFAHF